MSFTTEIWQPTTTTISAETASSINSKGKTTPIKQTNMPSSALPRTGELRQEDDWTKVKDPKEKKRIQNRVAQRTYRHRMKARLGELQARLESHEARRAQSADASDLPMGSLSTTFTTRTDGTHTEGSISPAIGSMPDKHDHIPPQALPPHFMQPNLYEQPVEDPENTLFPHITPHAVLHSPPPSQPSPTTHGLLSPPTSAEQQAQQQGPQSGKNSQEFMVDCLRFQSQLLNRLNNLQQETGFPTPYEGAPVGSDISEAGHVNCAPAFNHEGMGFSYQNLDMWKDHEMKMQQAGNGGDYYSGVPHSVPSSSGSMHPSNGLSGAAAIHTRKPSQNASLDERFECIMEQVDAAGFESFDAMATAYYTQNFAESSALADEQRLSRNRRLPQVISDVYGSAAAGWSDWERKGFQDEILRTAESMLTAEGVDARQALGGKITSLIEAQDNGNSAGALEAMVSMKRTLQEELPNSWAFTMALAADNRHSWQQDRSNTALATTLVLNFAGRIPNDQLLRLISACL